MKTPPQQDLPASRSGSGLWAPYHSYDVTHRGSQPSVPCAYAPWGTCPNHPPLFFMVAFRAVYMYVYFQCIHAFMC